jgi:uncharacterized protein
MWLSLLLAAIGWLPIEREVAFPGAGGFELKGTLAMPAGSSEKVPAVLLLPGSGPTDRNGNQPPMLQTDLLKQIASHLALQGIASLRFDKRAAHVYAPQWPKDAAERDTFFDWDKFVGDAKNALAFLRRQEGVHPSKVAIAGHSEGGLIAMQIGHDLAGSKDSPDALLLLGTAGRPLDFLIREQVLASLIRSGLDETARQPYVDYMEKAIAQIKAEAKVPPNPPAGLGPLINPSVARLLQTYFTLDPAVLLPKYPGPVLVVQGEKDIQVLAEKDFPALRAALEKRKSGRLETVLVEGASHNFKPVSDPNKEMGFSGTADPKLLDAVARFLKSL